MKTYIQPPRTAWEDLLTRPLQQENETIRKRVENIIERVRKDRDAALRELADQFDGVKIDSPAVTDDEIAKADELLDDALKNAIRQARENIIAFHRAQRMEPIRIETMPGVCCEQRSVAIHSGLFYTSPSPRD